MRFLREGLISNMVKLEYIAAFLPPLDIIIPLTYGTAAPIA